MLSLLHIENIAIIESADIRFDSGLNVLTGETVCSVISSRWASRNLLLYPALR